MDDEPWHVKRRRELEAATPVKRKRTTEPFVKLPLWWAEASAKAIRSPATLVLVELLRLRWKTQRTTFPLPNSRLQKLGISRKLKVRVLHDLERAGLITVKWRPRKLQGIGATILAETGEEDSVFAIRQTDKSDGSPIAQQLSFVFRRLDLSTGSL